MSRVGLILSKSTKSTMSVWIGSVLSFFLGGLLKIVLAT